MGLSKNESICITISLGIFIHLFLLVTVFDTYFKSPLESGMTPTQSTKTPPSKRVVLFVADGLRAHAILEENEHRTPFLTSIRNGEGSWGVSHTRVPTESRPGHVAMLAGIFEDPSAIFKGWKHNPVDFDSVINQSTNAWCIGSPDIVTIFNKDGRRHIHIHAYDAQMQDFGNKETTLLDKWVFNKTKEILISNGNKEFEKGGNIYFLHLLGLDTAGHAFKPQSKQYIDNIKFVDENVKEITKLFKETFEDDSTSFVFTADHGMTDWGSHGSGLDEETLTPFIAWGSGIKKNSEREDINQIDIAPLISSLIGINYPTNNLGKLPVNYLNIPQSKKLQNFLTNTLQIFKIFNEKQLKIEKSAFFYKPFKYITEHNFDKNFTDLWYSNASYEVVMENCEVLFKEILKGIDYCHNYFMNYILFSISSGLVLWIIYLSSFLSTEEYRFEMYENNFVRFAVFTYLVFVFSTCYLQSFPLIYYLYFVFPSCMLYILLDKFPVFFRNIPNKLDLTKCLYLLHFSGSIILFIFGFHYRSCFSLMMIFNAFSIFLNKGNYAHLKMSLRVTWILICMVLSIFPLLPLMFTKFQLSLFALGFLSWNFFSCRQMRRQLSNFKLKPSKYSQKLILIFNVQLLCFNGSFINSLIISFEYFENNYIFKYVSWLLFLIPLICIPFSLKLPEVRILSIFFAFAPFYLMTTMSYELFFLTFYCLFLIFWVEIEKNSRIISNKGFDTFRKCLIFVSTILIGFFGTGNIASLNSFDPMWVRCFLTIFSPFLMTILIFIKLVVPFLYSACVFREIVLKTGMKLMNSFCLILLISDIMVFYFLYNIKNVGSWLEIGMSLSHFIVVECFTLGILVLYFIAYILTNVDFNKVVLPMKKS